MNLKKQLIIFNIQNVGEASQYLKLKTITILRQKLIQVCRAVASGGRPPPVFGRTVIPMSTREADYAHHSTTSPPGFSDLVTGLCSDQCFIKRA